MIRRVPACSFPAGLLLALAMTALSVHAETDKRLHADGKGWRLDRAVITDPQRPRVLLIGDSILNGYLPLVVTGLQGQAHVDAWVNPHCQSTYLNSLLADVLTNGPYAVVHFNIGLHGWPEGRIKPGTFKPLTQAYVEVIRSRCPDAAILWASTTPVTVKGNPMALDPVINPVIIEHNAMAAEVMTAMKVPVNDFYGVLAGHLDWARGDQFHWTAPAYRTLGAMAESSIRSHLPQVRPAAPQR